MGYRLALAEKPSVAQAIAKVLGASKRCDGYLEGNGWLVSWCVGHLVELAEPESYDEKYRKWRYEDLPIFPEKWKYEVSPGTRKQFAVVKELMNRSDVTSWVLCTDSGREGELIGRLVYHMCGCPKPFHRLWISSMEDTAIRDGFSNLHPSSEYDNLYQAALCRERADWIVGMNVTRLFSLSEPLKNPNLFIWSTVVRSVSPEKGSDLLLLSGNQRLKTAVIVFPFGAYFGVVFVF